VVNRLLSKLLPKGDYALTVSREAGHSEIHCVFVQADSTPPFDIGQRFNARASPK
jgi:hypothetical protein